MASLGAGVKEIASAMNQQRISSPRGRRWGKSSVHALLTNVAYIGVMAWGVTGKLHGEGKLPPIQVENAWEALVDKDTFKAIGSNMASRAFRTIHPRRVPSSYLLSGLLMCGKCGVKMMGQSAKSGMFHYYVCGTAFRQGKHLCDTRPLPKNQIEELILEKVKSLVLREDHLKELVSLVNDELAGSLEGLKDRVGYIQSQRSDVEKRLERLFQTLETGTLEMENVAPRIKEHRLKLDLLARTETEVCQALDAGKVKLVDRQIVLEYVGHLGQVLSEGGVGERKTILKSFVEAIEIKGSEVTVTYTLPLPPETADIEDAVLSIVHDGPPLCTKEYPN